MKQPGLSVVIPAYNEEAILWSTLVRVSSYLESRRRSYEVIVVDDGSTDSTAAIATTFGDASLRTLSMPTNLGKGGAVRAGVLASRGKFVLISDADLSTPIEDLPSLETALGRAHLVFGSRSLPASRVLRPQPAVRRWMGRVFNMLARLAGADGFSDTQCGFKLLDGVVARRLFRDLVTTGFAWDVELIWLARRHGYRVLEEAVSWADHADSKVRPFRHALSMLGELIAFRHHHRMRARQDSSEESTTAWRRRRSAIDCTDRLSGGAAERVEPGRTRAELS